MNGRHVAEHVPGPAGLLPCLGMGGGLLQPAGKFRLDGSMAWFFPQPQEPIHRLFQNHAVFVVLPCQTVPASDLDAASRHF